MLERCKDWKTTVTWEGKSPRNIYGILEVDDKLRVKELQKGRSHGHGSVWIVRRSKLSMRFKGEHTANKEYCSQGILRSCGSFKKRKGRENHLAKRRRRTPTSPLVPSFGWCGRESSLQSQGEEAAELLEKSPLSGWSKVLKGV